MPLKEEQCNRFMDVTDYIEKSERQLNNNPLDTQGCNDVVLQLCFHCDDVPPYRDAAPTL